LIFGYARVSTREQHLGQQLDALETHGCDKIFQEKVSGQRSSRPALRSLLDSLREGDTLVCWKLDRIGRDYLHLEKTIRQLEADGVQLISLTENVDTSTPSGKLFYRMMSVFAEFEIDVTRERSAAGVDRARKAGKRIGRSYSGDRKLMELICNALIAGATVPQIKVMYKKAPSSPTVYRWKKKLRERDSAFYEYVYGDTSQQATEQGEK